jgi:hypothetical protein
MKAWATALRKRLGSIRVPVRRRPERLAEHGFPAGRRKWHAGTRGDACAPQSYPILFGFRAIGCWKFRAVGWGES